MDINHLDAYDLYPALLLLLIVTAVLAAAFTTGILLGLLRYIILPVLPALFTTYRKIHS